MTTRRRRLVAAVMTACTTTALGLTALGASSGPAAAAGSGAVAGDPAPFTITAPEKVTAQRYGRVAYVDLRVRAQTGADGFVMTSRRPSYEDQIVTQWTSGARTESLPEGTQPDFRGLPDFLDITYTSTDGEIVRQRTHLACFAGSSVRRGPEGPLENPYPQGCPSNPFTLGSVQGVPAGWATSVMGYGQSMRLPLGLYDVHVEVNPDYVDLFGLDPASSTHDLTLEVRKHRRWHGGFRPRPGGPTPDGAKPTAGTRPSEVRGGQAPQAAGPRPDLRALPAFGINLNTKGTFLRFAATVWNGGDSPLIIDGFRADRTVDEMDAYQYFVDSHGDETGYVKLDSQFHWHAANHRHWHYEDFAAYRLLDADHQPVRTSGKVSFCLANTDAVDYTLPGADWRPYNTDLRTACGRPGSLSVREVLSAGSGDTYAQYRAGQSIKVSDLPDGTYYVSVEPNPQGNIVESDYTNNTSERRVTLRTSPRGRRIVTAAPVGIIDDSLGFYRR